MNIEDYGFEDSDVQAVIGPERVELTYPDYFEHKGNCYSQVDVYRGDVIALAKHFKLTVNDLNTD